MFEIMDMFLCLFGWIVLWMIIFVIIIVIVWVSFFKIDVVVVVEGCLILDGCL